MAIRGDPYSESQPQTQSRSLREQNTCLRERIVRLEIQIKRLSEENIFLRNHKTLVAGLSGETIVSEIIGGRVTAYATSFDLEKNGVTIEIKFANTNNSSSQIRWLWQKILGESGNKRFDHLVLLAKKDPQWEHLYKDGSIPFVLFCIPWEKIGSITHSSGRYRAIQLTSNPKSHSAKQQKAFSLWELEVSYVELQKRFGLPD